MQPGLNAQASARSNEEEEDYYGNFARRVYYLADLESWPMQKTMQYFNDKPAFEKYYANVSGSPRINFSLLFRAVIDLMNNSDFNHLLLFKCL